MLHELGHGLVDLYQIPVLGREEDAAGPICDWWMSPDGAENGTDAIAAVRWWMASGQQSGLKREQLPWWDEHGMDEQRGFQVRACCTAPIRRSWNRWRRASACRRNGARSA